MELTNREWKEFPLKSIFNIERGNRLVIRERIDGKYPFATAGFSNQGIVGYIANESNKTYSNYITIDMFGNTFFRPYEFKCDDNIHVLIPKDNISSPVAKFITTCISKSVFNIYSYGKQFRIKSFTLLKISLPNDSKGEPDYTFMENYMRQKETELLKQYKKQVSDFETTVPLSEKAWKEFKTTDIFNDIQRGRRLKKEDHKRGLMPYVSSTGINNGVDGFVSNNEDVRIFSNCLTLANSGSVGATFYQPFTFVASDHVTKLESRNFNKYIYLFIANITSRFSKKYGFNREINDTRIKKEKILLPVNSKKEPDYAFMENYMKAMESKKIRQYLEYRKS